MANFYCDVSAVGNEYQAYAATPTWGALSTDTPLPMDGNGKAGPGHSAAVAIAELQITVLPADGNTLTIAGAVLTAKTTAAAKNQWTITGAISTCVTNLVALLNTYGTGTAQCDAAVSTSASAKALALPYWQFARVKPGTTDTIQLATRVAGTTMNYATNSAVAITSSGWGTPPTITNFTGGADGPFAYFVNPSAIFGIALGLGGIWSSKSLAKDEPGASDVILVRTMRSSANLAVTVTAAASSDIVCRTPASSTRAFLFDDGTTWSGDNGQFQLDLINNTSGYTNYFECSSAATVYLHAREQYGLRVRGKTSSSGAYTYVGGASGNSKIHIKKVLYEAYDATPNTQLVLGIRNSYDERVIFEQSKLLLKTNRSPWVSLSSNYNIWVKCINSIFEWTGIGANVTALLTCGGNMFLSSSGGAFEFIGCEFIVDGGTSRKVALFMSGGNAILSNCLGRFVIEDCKGLVNPSIGMLPDSAKSPARPVLYWRDSDTGSFRLEGGSVTVDYVSTGTVPTLGDTTAMGTDYAHRFSWEASRLDNNYQYDVGAYSYFYRGSETTKTVTLEMLTPSAEVPKKSQLYGVVSYIDSGNVKRVETTGVGHCAYLEGSVADLDNGVGTGSWTLNGVTGVDSKKISLTTTYAVKQNTEISLRLMIGGAPTGTRNVYVAPVLRVT